MNLLSHIPIKFFRVRKQIAFMKWRKISLSISGASLLASSLLVFTLGINLGIDFKGGILMEVRTEVGTSVAQVRKALDAGKLGEVSVQEFGVPTDMLIRIEQQAGGEAGQQQAIETARERIGAFVTDWRRVEFVGPVVGKELITAGLWAVIGALSGVLLYVWFRFEWQYGLAAIVALAHDVVLTVGLFALTGLEFSLSTIAALLTVAGYSINDTVVVFDRIRENTRKYKKTEMSWLLDNALMGTLSRTLITSLTTLLALISLAIFGGEIIRTFTWALVFGVLIGTYSSLMVATPLLLFFKLRPSDDES